VGADFSRLTSDGFVIDPSTFGALVSAQPANMAISDQKCNGEFLADVEVQPGHQGSMNEPMTAAGLPLPDDRRRGGDRRRRVRPEPGRRASDALRATFLAAFCSFVASSPAEAQQPIRFGVDAKAASQGRGLGLPVTYASTWAGAWVQKYGWGGVEADLRAAKAADAIPVVQFWYWGDDISPSCVENGCQDLYHGVWKDRATWQRLSGELADLIARVMGDVGALVVVETEFNKNGIENHEPFDGYLAEQLAMFRGRGHRAIVSFGNWNKAAWGRFDRAVAAADLIGAMVLYSSVREPNTYLSGPEALLSAARYNQATFHRPSFVTDFAFSSYPDTTYELYQDTVVREIFSRMDEFRAAGVQGMVWRMLSDNPNFDTANYHGVAERHWGLVRADGTRKLAFTAFRNGVLAEAERLTPAPAAPSPEPTVPSPEPIIAEPTPGAAPAGSGSDLRRAQAALALVPCLHVPRMTLPVEQNLLQVRPWTAHLPACAIRLGPLHWADRRDLHGRFREQRMCRRGDSDLQGGAWR